MDNYFKGCKIRSMNSLRKSIFSVLQCRENTVWLTPLLTRQKNRNLRENWNFLFCSWKRFTFGFISSLIHSVTEFFWAKWKQQIHFRASILEELRSFLQPMFYQGIWFRRINLSFIASFIYDFIIYSSRKIRVIQKKT